MTGGGARSIEQVAGDAAGDGEFGGVPLGRRPLGDRVLRGQPGQAHFDDQTAVVAVIEHRHPVRGRRTGLVQASLPNS